MSEPLDDWPCKYDISPEQRTVSEEFSNNINDATKIVKEGDTTDFTFPCEASCEDSDEVTETKIRAFLDEKVCNYQPCIFNWSYCIMLELSDSDYIVLVCPYAD